MTRIHLLPVVLAWLLAIPVEGRGQQPSSSAGERNLVAVGASLLMPLMTDIAQRFERENSGVRIELRLTGVSEGLSVVRAGRADVAMLQRDLQKGELDLFGHPIARDGVAVVVNGANPVKNMTAKDLTAIVTGRVQNWKSLGGRDAPIRLGWLSGEGLSYFMLNYLRISSDQLGPHTLLPDNAAALKFAESDANALALASVAIAEQRMRAAGTFRTLSFEGFVASNRTIQNHTYPPSRPMLLVTRAVPTGLQGRFIAYAGSPHVLDLQLKHGFVPYEESWQGRGPK